MSGRRRRRYSTSWQTRHRMPRSTALGWSAGAPGRRAPGRKPVQIFRDVHVSTRTTPTRTTGNGEPGPGVFTTRRAPLRGSPADRATTAALEVRRLVWRYDLRPVGDDRTSDTDLRLVGGCRRSCGERHPIPAFDSVPPGQLAAQTSGRAGGRARAPQASGPCAPLRCARLGVGPSSPQRSVGRRRPGEQLTGDTQGQTLSCPNRGCDRVRKIPRFGGKIPHQCPTLPAPRERRLVGRCIRHAHQDSSPIEGLALARKGLQGMHLRRTSSSSLPVERSCRS